MRNPPTAIVDALNNAAQDGLIERDMVTFQPRNASGETVVFAFWTGNEDDAFDVPTAAGGTALARAFTGRGELISAGEVKLTTDLSVQRVSVVLSAIAPRVLDMLNGHDLRLAPVEIHRALFDPSSRQLLAAPDLHLAGEVNAAPRETAAAGGESAVTIECVSDTRQLTRTNPARRGDAFLAARSNDRFYRYVNAVVSRPIFWGEAKS